MLAIRLQRVGRSGLAQYRIIVQEAQRQPTSGRVVAFVGTYNPYTKEAKIQVADAQKFLDNGAQPSPRVVKLLAAAGVKMPKWVAEARVNTKVARKAEKLRKNQPAKETAAEEKAEVVAEPRDEHMAEEPAEEPSEDTEPVENLEPVETVESVESAETPVEPRDEHMAEEPAVEDAE